VSFDLINDNMKHISSGDTCFKHEVMHSLLSG